jgi:hypothetical protein
MFHRCDCPWNYTGPACQTLHAGFCVKRLGVDNPINTCKDGNPTLCVNACNGRGDCKGGFCHCKPGAPTALGKLLPVVSAPASLVPSALPPTASPA